MRVSILISSDDELVKIDSLKCYPLRFAPAELKAKLEKRGEKFWGLQYRNFVEYQDPDEGALNTVSFTSTFLTSTSAYLKGRALTQW